MLLGLIASAVILTGMYIFDKKKKCKKHKWVLDYYTLEITCSKCGETKPK